MKKYINNWQKNNCIRLFYFFKNSHFHTERELQKLEKAVIHLREKELFGFDAIISRRDRKQNSMI